VSNDFRDDWRDVEREGLWALPRVLLALLALFVGGFLIAVAATPLTIGFGWFHGEANLRSFTHVQQTYQLAYDDIGALRAMQANACVAKQAVDSATPDIKPQRESQLLAIENNYNRVAQEYDAYMSDHFRGKIYHPADLPMPAPDLDLTACP